MTMKQELERLIAQTENINRIKNELIAELAELDKTYPIPTN
jgi:hypothetical protein